MKTPSHNNNAINLSAQIKRAIGYRIFICFLLAFSVVLVITSAEITSGSRQLENNIKEQCKTLESFVISQSLINNEDAIPPKMEALNQQPSSTGTFTWSNKTFSSTQKQLHWKPPFYWIYYYPVKSMDGKYLGTLVVSGHFFKENALILDLVKKITLLLLFFIIIFVVLYPLGQRIPEQLFISPVNELLLLLRNENNKLTTDKLSNLPEEINEIKDKIATLLKDAENRSHEAALWKIAMQVAHDIRSPLLVLNLETSGLPSVSEDKRILIREAIQRVNDIANNLLSQYKNGKTNTTNEIAFTPEPLTAMIESIISEKRVQISNTSIRIEFEKNANAHALFVNLDIAGFKRALSNIINNSIEAINQHGLINIKLYKESEKIIIRIIDNGSGIPEHILPLIAKPGASFGKANGSGLGLSYTINKIHSWNGDYKITTKANEGTTFDIILPCVNPPNWFASNLSVPQNGTLVILDDDNFIHHAWKQRFSDAFIKEHNLTLVHFHSADELITWKNYANINETVFLLDYELAGSEKNGLLLAKELEIKNKSILVTSRHEDIDIKKSCQELGMQMIPKSSVITVPIKIIKHVDLIFIDDDKALTYVWEKRAKLSGKNIETFNNIHDFMRIYDLYKKDTLIYIDSSLNADLKGEYFAKILYENGYHNIFIATGYEKEVFKDVYWVKGIIDKYPPF